MNVGLHSTVLQSLQLPAMRLKTESVTDTSALLDRESQRQKSQSDTPQCKANGRQDIATIFAMQGRRKLSHIEGMVTESLRACRGTFLTSPSSALCWQLLRRPLLPIDERNLEPFWSGSRARIIVSGSWTDHTCSY